MSENAIIQHEQEQMPAITYDKQAVINVWQDKEAFEQTARVASMLAKSTIVPEIYRNKPEDCFIAVEMAARMNTSPIFIMQNLYVVKGKPTWAGQACMAMIMSCGKFKNVRHVYTGQIGTDNRGCYVEAVRIQDGELIRGTEVTISMAKNEGWMGNSKWKNMPEQMLGYRAASFFARMYCPEAMMGLQTTEEVYDASPAVEKHSAKSLADAIKAEEKSVEEPVSEPVKQQKEEPAEEPKPKKKSAPKCEECGKDIEGVAGFTAEKLAKLSKEKYGKCLCVECGKKAKEALEASKQEESKNDLASALMADAEK